MNRQEKIAKAWKKFQNTMSLLHDGENRRQEKKIGKTWTYKLIKHGCIYCFYAKQPY